MLRTPWPCQTISYKNPGVFSEVCLAGNFILMSTHWLVRGEKTLVAHCTVPPNVAHVVTSTDKFSSLNNPARKLTLSPDEI